MHKLWPDRSTFVRAGLATPRPTIALKFRYCPDVCRCRTSLGLEPTSPCPFHALVKEELFGSIGMSLLWISIRVPALQRHTQRTPASNATSAPCALIIFRGRLSDLVLLTAGSKNDLWFVLNRIENAFSRPDLHALSDSRIWLLSPMSIDAVPIRHGGGSKNHSRLL